MAARDNELTKKTELGQSGRYLEEFQLNTNSIKDFYNEIQKEQEKVLDNTAKENALVQALNELYNEELSLSKKQYQYLVDQRKIEIQIQKAKADND